MTEFVLKAPFSLIGVPFIGFHPMKKWPQAGLQALLSDR
jgi:hypothetical protein